MEYIYIYIYIYRDSLVKSPQWEPSIPQQLNANVFRGGVWNVHNFCETCTTSCNRGQLLWFRWQVLKNWKELLIRLHPYIYIYIYLFVYLFLYHDIPYGVYLQVMRAWSAAQLQAAQTSLRTQRASCLVRRHGLGPSLHRHQPRGDPDRDDPGAGGKHSAPQRDGWIQWCRLGCRRGWGSHGISDFFSMDMFDHLLALGWGSSGVQWSPVAFWVKHVGVWHCLTMKNWFQTGSQTGLSPRCRCHRGWFGSLCCREPRGNPKPPSKGASDGGQRQCNGVPWIHSLPEPLSFIVGWGPCETAIS